MIQRIQSVYLLLAAICLAIAHLFPLATFTSIGKSVIPLNARMTLCTLHIENGVQITSLQWPLLTINTIAIIGTIAIIFLYKNRGLQRMLASYLSYFVILLIFVSVVTVLKFRTEMDTTLTPGLSGLFLIIAFLFQRLACKAIHKDEELIKAADRIR